jgi:hypothetical protein
MAMALRLLSRILKEQEDALDNLYHSAGFVGVGDGNLLYRRGVDSPLVGGRVGRSGNPSVSRT